MWQSFLIFIFVSGIFLARILKKTPNQEPSFWKYHINFYFFYFVCLFVAVLISPLVLVRPRDVRNAKLAVRLPAIFLNKLLDIKWEIRNQKILTVDQGAVIVCNHQSSLDVLGWPHNLHEEKMIIGVMATSDDVVTDGGRHSLEGWDNFQPWFHWTSCQNGFGMANIWHIVGKMAAVAKKELLYAFPFGFTAYLSGVVFIDRSNPKSAKEKLAETSEIMHTQKTKIWLFPEGTRNKDYTKLLPFKKGAFNIAVAAQVPIIPVVFSPYYFVNAQKHIFSKGHIIIQILDPIPTVGLTADDVPELTAKVYEKMSDVYRELSKEVFNELPVRYPYSNIG